MPPYIKLEMNRATAEDIRLCTYKYSVYDPIATMKNK